MNLQAVKRVTHLRFPHRRGQLLSFVTSRWCLDSHTIVINLLLLKGKIRFKWRTFISCDSLQLLPFDRNVRVSVRMCCFFLCVIFARLCVCVCKQGSKMLSTWSLSKHALTPAHTQTTAPWWVRGDNGPTGGKQSAEVYREEERGNAL